MRAVRGSRPYLLQKDVHRLLQPGLSPEDGCQRSCPYMRLETANLPLLSAFAFGGGRSDVLHRVLYRGYQLDKLRRCYLFVEFVGRPEAVLLQAGACMQSF